MARELLLLRHGKSDWSEQVEDFKRPLKDRGKRGAQRIGVWLLANISFSPIMWSVLLPSGPSSQLRRQSR